MATLLNKPASAALRPAPPQGRSRGSASVSTEMLASLERQGARFYLPSYAQRRLWFIHQWEGASATYNIPVAAHLTGALDVCALEKSLNEIVQRHETLRTSFANLDGKPIQIVTPVLPLPLGRVDLEGLPEAARRAEAHRLVVREARWFFDPDRSPLLRASLLQLAEGEHLLVLVMHHIVSDGWSLGVLIGELEIFYKAFSTGKVVRLPDLPIQYSDYVYWQRAWLESDRLSEGIAYWTDELSGSPPLLELPTDRPRPAVQSFRGAIENLVLPDALAGAAGELSRKQSTTLFITLLAVFQTLLHRYSGQKDFLVGSPVANRNSSESEALIGLFVNTLVFRAELGCDTVPSGGVRGGSGSFRELVSRVHETAIEGYSHQEVPFEKLVEELRPERSFAYSPLFQVMFALQNHPLPNLRLGDLEMSSYAFDHRTSKFDLSLVLFEDGESLGGFVEYSTDLFDRSTIQRFVRHFANLGHEALERPEAALAELSALSAVEWAQLLSGWNDTAHSYPGSETMASLFAAQAEQTPESAAVRCEDRVLSYRDLDRRSNLLAHHLRRRGVGPEAVVGVYADRSLEMVVAVMGIFKAESAYLPLDPQYPADRLAFMMADSGLSLLLTRGSLVSSLPELAAPVLCLDTQWREIEDGLAQDSAERPPERRGNLQNLVAVPYTSGSTGRPKGTMICERGFLNLCLWFRRHGPMTQRTRSLILINFAFDAWLKNVVGPLLCGGEVVLPAPGLFDAEALWKTLVETRSTLINSTPSMMYPIVQRAASDDYASLASLEYLSVGGEPTVMAELRPWLTSENCRVAFIHMYGPSECSDIVSSYRSRPGEVGEVDKLPIGRPLDNERVVVLDRHGGLQPIGVVGELCVSGDNLARGYLHRPGLTAERFVPNPFETGERMYKTGDLVRWQRGGNLEFMGRVDDQVKVRGVRIELGEVETALAEHPAVRDLVVLAREDRSGTQRLVAYVVPDGEEAPSAAELREFLQASLPENLVPSAFVTLASIPLTPNGKLDKKHLPEPEYEEAERAYEAPRTPAEELLAGIWAEVLEVDRVGVHDEFFDLGGHSLLATQVISRARQVFAVEVPVVRLFEAPTVAALAAVVEAEQAGGSGLEAPPIVPLRRDRPLPLSFAQERLWFVDQLVSENPFYNIPFSLRLAGRFDLAVMERTVSEIVRRHESLRTSFRTSGGEAVQVIHPPQPFPIPLIDLSALPRHRRERTALGLAAAEAVRPFDLREAPMLRLTVMRFAEELHGAAFTLHHIASDGWSAGVLLRELTVLYEAFSRGRPSPLAELPVQYADYALWQRGWLRGEVLDAQLSFWQELLEGAPEVLDLPFDRPRPKIESFRGSTVSFELPAPLLSALGGLARRHGATRFMTVLALFKVLLYRHTGQEDVVVGSSIAGRTRQEIEDLIGFFVNTQVLRTRLDGQPSYLEVLQRVRTVTLGAFAHQEVPFEKLVEEMAPQRDLSHSPLCQVKIAYQNFPDVDPAGCGFTLEPLGEESAGGTGTAKFDLTFYASEVDGAFAGVMEYNRDLFDRSTVARWAKRFEVLARGVAARPQEQISRLPVWNAAERHQVLVGWNDSEGQDAVHRHDVFHRLYEARAARVPGNVAVASGGRQLTYGELDDRAGRLARRLRRLGVGTDRTVGLFLESSLEMVVALLGVLKAGGAYSALDPKLPKARLAALLEDLRPVVVLTLETWLEALPAHGGATLRMDTQWAAIAREDAAPLNGDARPESLAYVVFTSGTTGRSKAVGVEHRALLHYVSRVRQRLELPTAGSFATVSTFGADLGHTMVFPALAGGGCLHVLTPEAASDPAVVADYFGRHPIDCLKIVPSHMEALASSPERGRLLPRRRLVLGGEAARWDLVEDLYRSASETCRIFNHYGPSESTVGVATHAVRRGRRGRGATVPIGRPLAHADIYLLDARLRPVPAGAPGELSVGGAGLARGYLGRPGRTAEKFVPYPWSESPGRRLYKTGDLARHHSGGEIGFLGRLDDQVKVRGVRVELGEVETALAQHPEIRDLAVVARQTRPGEQHLVAYLVGQGEAAPTAAELRQFLQGSLPEALVPSAFVEVDALPRTPNGKVDRARLPAPEPRGSEGAAEEPRTPSEELLAGIWGEVLGLERVGIRDDFFDLGGHSLLATRVVSRVRQVSGVEVALVRLFEAPTVAGLARAVEAARARGDGLEAPPIVALPRTGSVPLSFSQQRLWFLHQLLPGLTAYNLPAALAFEGRLDAGLLERALGEVLRRHDVLRTTFASVAGEPVQRIAAPAPFRLPRVDLGAVPRALRQRESRRLARDEARQPFDLARGPLLRGALLRLASDEHVVLLDQHHIVSDAWSRGLLVREVTALYEALAAGRPAPLPELAVQYADYAVWQRRWLRGEVLERQLGWWRERLFGMPALLELPLDRPRPPLQTFGGAWSALELSAPLVRDLRAAGRQAGTTVFMTLLAAYQALLGRLSGQSDVSVGSPVAGRHRLETEPLIGFFVNMLVMRADLSGDPRFSELLARVREGALGAYAHQDVPFEKLVDEIVPERSTAHAPLFQVNFVLQNAPRGELRLHGPLGGNRGGRHGVTVRQIETEIETTQFDLVLTLWEEDDRVVGGLSYNTALFDGSTIQRTARYLRTLLDSALRDPAQRLSKLSVHAPAARAQLLQGWNDTATAYAEPDPAVGGGLAGLFETRAGRTPEAVAVRCRRRALTYRELDRRANQLAHALRSRGVGPEVVVGVFAERSLELVTAVAGILKAGGAYLPLDPQYPKDRLAFMAADSAASLFLTQERLAADLPQTERPVVRLDADWAEIARHRGAAPPKRCAGPRNLVAVPYTSGSTGRPKGTMIEERGFLNLCLWYRRHAPIGAATRSLVLINFSFDAWFKNVLAPLLAGGEVVLPTPGPFDAEDLHTTISEQRATLINSTPSMMYPIVQRAAADGYVSLSSLEYLSVGGESTVMEKLRPWLSDDACRTAFIHMYGPSECSDIVSSYRSRRGEVDEVEKLPIGRPIDNARGYVLDRHGRPQPVDVAGELTVSGDNLARGYLNRPGLTAERFVPNPFEIGSRMYRTGDLVRWQRDGHLEFMGRMDDQVKVRGVRIELGEIEAALAQHPGVRDLTVLARQDRRGEKRLVAYVVAEGEAVPAAELRGFLQARLPKGLVPAAFVELESMPLTPNGKVDRTALGRMPLPEPEEDRPERLYEAPRTPVEELMAGIWAEVLALRRVGIRDDFFELGGHSILATQVVSRVRESFGVELPLVKLFDEPTVAGLTAAVQDARTEGDGSDPSRPGRELPPPRPIARRGNVPLSYSQLRFWNRRHAEAGLPASNLANGFAFSGALEVAVLRRSLQEIVRRHEILRTTFTESGGLPVQVVRSEVDPALPMVDLAGLRKEIREEELRRLATRAQAFPFDLAVGPLFRLTLIRLSQDEQSQEEHVLFLVIHHIITDGWSAGVIAGEVNALYEAFLCGEPSPLPELAIQYADYTLWQRQALRGPRRAELLRYWTRKLDGGALSALQLPHDEVPPGSQRRPARLESVSLGVRLAKELRSFSLRENASLFMTVLAAYKALLYSLTGQEDISLTANTAGRGHVDVERLVGLFTNAVILRNDLSGDPSFRELLGRVRETTLDAYAHEGLPIVELTKELWPGRSTVLRDLFPTGMAFQNFRAQETSLSNLTVRLFKMESGVGRRELGFFVVPDESDITLALKYKTDLFRSTTVRSILERFKGLLEAAIQDPARKLTELRAISEGE